MLAFAINLALAVVWFLLGEPPTAERFFVGFILGFLVFAVLCAGGVAASLARGTKANGLPGAKSRGKGAHEPGRIRD